MTTLFHLAVSPWSERSRWALDLAGIEYERVEHVPFVGEALLRRRAGARKATVPLLATDEGPVIGSWAIARWADEHGKPGLFPDGELDEIERWNTLSEKLLNIERARTFPRLAQNKAALMASVPKALRFLGPVALASARQGVRFMTKKYREQGKAGTEEALREGLRELRAGLAGRATLLGSFSYADITMACALQGIRPVDDRWLPLTGASREVWSEPTIAAEVSDLLAWRDALYSEHRTPA